MVLEASAVEAAAGVERVVVGKVFELRFQTNNFYMADDTIFPKGEPASPDHFTGTVSIYTLVPNNDKLHFTSTSVTFEAGARTNWHKHSGGQVLIVTNGAGQFQESGKPVQSIKKGDVVTVMPGTKHWHGASPNSALTHIAVNMNTQNGIVDWLERVTDEEYNKQ